MYEYLGITEENEATITRSGSKFIAKIFPVFSQNEVKEKIAQLRSNYPAASHICYAAILDLDKKNQIFSDAGEPNNSAGRPILHALLSTEVTFVLCAIIRYYGGKKLGIPGLIEAYNTAATEVLKMADISKQTIKKRNRINFDSYPDFQIFNVLKKNGVENYDLLENSIEFSQELSKVKQLEMLLNEMGCDFKSS